ncbi:hypothetical protein [Frigoribacterium sp. UYMn621]|uniref:hypothetical protein n=1 Tax=Frigoribacterium sp. UYMn621 TaxID=3156343 RepID=UPI003392DAB4
MTSLLLERPDTAPDDATREAVAPERLCWSGLNSDGICTWGEALGLISLVGVQEEFTFLTLYRDAAVDPAQRFFQCTGGGPKVGGRLLAEIGNGNDVAVMAPWDAAVGRRVEITTAEPWAYSEADEQGLLPREELLAIAYEWVMHGKVSPKYRLRRVPTFNLPVVNL